MKNGLYAIYDGREYEAGTKGNDIVVLRSRDSKDAQNGFTLYKNLIYTKSVKRSEVEKLYSLVAISVYKGLKFEVIKEDNDMLLIGSMKGDYNVFEELGMEKVDKGVYEKWITKNETTLVYEQTEIL